MVWPGPAGYRNPDLYARFWKIVEHYRIAAMSAVPTVYATLARVPVDADISSLRLPVVGASPLPPVGAGGLRRAHRAAAAGRVRADRGHLRHHLHPAGQGTTPDRSAGSWPGSGSRRYASATTGRGRTAHPARSASWRSADRPCSPGTSPTRHWAGRGSAGTASCRDGWLNTGDLGSVDPDGYVYLTGRAKDLIIRGGHNIDPRVIEDGAAAATPRSSPPPRSGGRTGTPARSRSPTSCPADPDRFDEAELLAWAATAIGEPAARPKRIHPIPAIPTTAVGKQYKPALVADAAARAVSRRAGRRRGTGP